MYSVLNHIPDTYQTFYLIFTTTWDGYSYPCTDEETESQRALVTCSRTHSRWPQMQCCPYAFGSSTINNSLQRWKPPLTTRHTILAAWPQHQHCYQMHFTNWDLQSLISWTSTTHPWRGTGRTETHVLWPLSLVASPEHTTKQSDETNIFFPWQPGGNILMLECSGVTVHRPHAQDYHFLWAV